MKIRVVMCLKNEKYMSRILDYYENHYEKLERFDIHMFSSYDLAREYTETHTLDIFLMDDKYKDIELPMGNFLCVYLTEENSLDTLNGIKAISKYQKAEMLFGELFSFFAESVEDRQYKFTSDNAKLNLFQSSSGGSGCTAVSIAYACALAEQGKKVLYLNLENVPEQDVIFKGEGENDFSEVIYAVKSGSSNLAMKILSCMSQDKSGVYFIKSCKNILNMDEITPEDMKMLISTLKESCDFEYIVVDKDFGVGLRDVEVMKQAEKITFIVEANSMSQRKLVCITEALKIIDSQLQTDISERISIIFNKYKENQQIFLEGNCKILGGFPEYENKEIQQVVYYLSKMKMLKTW